jgi:cobalt-zinc-cadmium efflux system outer membrane protein
MTGDHPCGARGAPAGYCATPIIGRSLLALALLASLSPVVGAQQPTLTESKAIELALSRPAYRDLEQARIATTQSEVVAAGLWPNPTIGWDRNRVGGPGGDSTETTLVLSQTVDISGRRSLRRDAAEKRVEAARFEGEDRRLARVAEVRRHFAEVLHRHRTQAALEEWQRRIETTSTTIGRLAKSGEVSGYDRRRLEREAQTARARTASTGADYARSRYALAALTGQPDASPGGDLLPRPVPPLETLQASLGGRPDLASLDAQLGASEQERSAAVRSWIPDVTVGVGQKRVNDPFRSDQGPVVALSIPIPLFDRGDHTRQRAEAQTIALRSERELVQSKSHAELRGTWQQAMELRNTAHTFRQGSPGSRDLSRIAEMAYRAGEGSMLELLDAYRTELETELTALDLELRARLARIELDLLSGAKLYE